jgi:hypothetical protein
MRPRKDLLAQAHDTSWIIKIMKKTCSNYLIAWLWETPNQLWFDCVTLSFKNPEFKKKHKIFYWWQTCTSPQLTKAIFYAFNLFLYLCLSLTSLLAPPPAMRLIQVGQTQCLVCLLKKWWVLWHKNGKKTMNEVRWINVTDAIQNSIRNRFLELEFLPLDILPSVPFIVF